MGPVAYDPDSRSSVSVGLKARQTPPGPTFTSQESGSAFFHDQHGRPIGVVVSGANHAKGPASQVNHVSWSWRCLARVDL